MRVKFVSFFAVLIILTLSSNYLKGQFYTVGNDPACVKWREIKTGNFKIIYPVGIDSLAQRYAQLLEAANEWVQKPLKIKPNPIDVVLHPFNAKSNGVVVWAPKRVELMTKPLAFGGYSQNWEKQLVIHELRHVGQISKFEHGVFKPLSWLIGQQAQGIGIGLYLDKWALEGDAVVSETEFSSSGRGRDPEQTIFFKASFLNGDYRSWREWKLGSGRKYTPDIYSLGYFVNSFVRYTSGNYYYMGDLSEYLIKHFYNPSGARRAYRKTTGKSIPGHFSNMKEILGNKWKIEDSLKAPFTPYQTLNKKQRDYSSYKSVVAISADSLFAIKWNMDEPARLIFMDSCGMEKRVSYMGDVSSYLSYSKGRIYWTEEIYSPRWEQLSYSVLKCYDLKLRKVKTLTQKTSYSNCAVSLQGDTIAVAEYLVGGKSRLALLDSTEYKPFAIFDAPENGQLKESVFCGGKIYSTVITDKGMALFSLDIRSGQWSREIKESYSNIRRMNAYLDFIFFESDLNGTNNIYSYQPEVKLLQRLTNARFGAFAPYPERRSGDIFYSEYDKDGYDAVKAKQEGLLWAPSSFEKPYKFEIADMLSLQSGFSIDTVAVSTDKKYVSVPYPKFSNLIRIHSWSPFYYDADNIKNMTKDGTTRIVSSGFTVTSQNTLSTATTMLGYSYSNGFHGGHLKFFYTGFYPVIEIAAQYNTRNREEIRLVRDSYNRKHQLITEKPHSPYFSSSVFAYLPINMSGGGWSRGLIPKVLLQYENDSYYSEEKGKYKDYQYMSLGLQYYSMLNLSTRDIFPKWGLGVNLQMNTVPFSGENFGSLIYSNVYGYVPGIMPNHGLRLSLACQLQNSKGKNYLMSNVATSPRGYAQLYGKRYLSMSADYVFPIYLGDTEVSVLFYLRRLQVRPFVDWAYNKGMTFGKHLLSVGSDVMVDFNLFNIYLPLSAGFRYARTLDNTNFVQFLFQMPL